MSADIVYCISFGFLIADNGLDPNQTTKSMGESFQDYSWIQEFEADFP